MQSVGKWGWLTFKQRIILLGGFQVCRFFYVLVVWPSRKQRIILLEGFQVCRFFYVLVLLLSRITFVGLGASIRSLKNAIKGLLAFREAK